MHNVHAAAAELAGVINGVVDLSPIEVGLHDEIFQGGQPVLAGVDAASTYCYLLEAVEHRDADTWGVHLLEASAQGLDPKFTVADSGSGLRAGQQQAWPDTPCHGDVFHIQHQIEGVANTLARIVQGHTTRCKALQARIDNGHRRDRKRDLLGQRESARQGVLAGKLSAISQVHDTPETLVREALGLHRLPSRSQAYWQGMAGLGSASRCVGEATLLPENRWFRTTPTISGGVTLLLLVSNFLSVMDLLHATVAGCHRLDLSRRASAEGAGLAQPMRRRQSRM